MVALWRVLPYDVCCLMTFVFNDIWRIMIFVAIMTFVAVGVWEMDEGLGERDKRWGIRNKGWGRRDEVCERWGVREMSLVQIWIWIRGKNSGSVKMILKSFPKNYVFLPSVLDPNIKVYTNLLIITFFVKQILPKPKLGSLA